MIESVLDQESAVNATLIRTGKRELQITALDKSLLQELRDFLQPFRNFSDMVSGNVAHPGYVTLIHHEIQNLCKPVSGNSTAIKELKRLVLANLSRRLPESDLTCLATLLDPGTKDAVDLSRDEKVSYRTTILVLSFNVDDNCSSVAGLCLVSAHPLFALQLSASENNWNVGLQNSKGRSAYELQFSTLLFKVYVAIVNVYVCLQIAKLKAACETTAHTQEEHDRASSDTFAAAAVAVTLDGLPISSNVPVGPCVISAKRRLVENILKSNSRLSGANEDKLNAELSSYVSCQPSQAEADDALLFWKNRATLYPTLQRVARRYLTVSASSVPVESMFSTTGLILNSKRMSLAPHKLNYCTFIHDNAR